MRLLIEFLISVLSSIGFGVITNIPKRALLPAGITGGVSWCAYWLISLQDHSLILPNFTATVIIGLLGNYFAIRHRVPVNTIYIPSLVSLVPGGIAYLGARSFTKLQSCRKFRQNHREEKDHDFNRTIDADTGCR